MEKVTESETVTKVPVLKITINKKYHGPSLNSRQQRHLNVPNATNTSDAADKVHISNSSTKTEANVTNRLQNIIVPPKPLIFNLLPVVSDKLVKRRSTGIEVRNDIFIPKTAYTRKGDLSRDNVRNQTSAERIRYLYTKAQRDCDILRIRLKALRERQKQEEEEIKKLHTHLGSHFKDDDEESFSDVPEYSKRKRSCITFEDKEQEVKYEKLLKEVKKIKFELSNQRYLAAAPNKKLEATDLLYNGKSEDKRGLRKLTDNSHNLERSTVEHGGVTDKDSDECDVAVKKIKEEPITSFKSEDHGSVYFDEEYLDPIFLD